MSIHAEANASPWFPHIQSEPSASNVGNIAAPEGNRLTPIKALSRLVQEIYQASSTLPMGKFENHIFLPLLEYLPLDSAWLGRSTITSLGPVLHESYTYGLPDCYVAEWQKVMQDDPLAPQVISNPGKAATARATDSNLSQPFRNFAAKFGLAQFVCCIHIDPVLKTCTHLSGYRERFLPEFGADEIELLENFLPILAASISINRIHHIDHLKAESSNRQFSVGICTQHGVVQYAESGFAETVLMEWPSWGGSVLPGDLTNAAVFNKTISFVGRSIAAELEWEMENLLMVKIRPKTATDSLTPRELAIARMFGEGKTYKEVAKHLGISPATVRHHLRQAYTKLNVQNKAEIAWLLR